MLPAHMTCVKLRQYLGMTVHITLYLWV